jgi:hypothetical protein
MNGVIGRSLVRADVRGAGRVVHHCRGLHETAHAHGQFVLDDGREGSVRALQLGVEHRGRRTSRAWSIRSATLGSRKTSAYFGSDSAAVGSVSGSGAYGMSAWWSSPSSYVWKDADRWKIGCPCWTATTLRVVKERPSRMRSTV